MLIIQGKHSTRWPAQHRVWESHTSFRSIRMMLTSCLISNRISWNDMNNFTHICGMFFILICWSFTTVTVTPHGLYDCSNHRQSECLFGSLFMIQLLHCRSVTGESSTNNQKSTSVCMSWHDHKLFEWTTFRTTYMNSSKPLLQTVNPNP